MTVENFLQKRWLNPSEFEDEYDFSKSTQAKMRMESHPSTIPFSKIGKFIRYDRILIDKWLEDHQIQGSNRINKTYADRKQNINNHSGYTSKNQNTGIKEKSYASH